MCTPVEKMKSRQARSAPQEDEDVEVLEGADEEEAGEASKRRRLSGAEPSERRTQGGQLEGGMLKWTAILPTNPCGMVYGGQPTHHLLPILQTTMES